MIIYIASQAATETISSACATSEQLVVNAESSNEFNLQKYIKQNITQFQGIEKFIIDLEACVDFEDEIIESIISLKMVYNALRIIVIAGNRQPGDDLLTKIFNLGIMDIICTEDRVEMKRELIVSLNEGKSFRDALIFKDAKKEKIVIKNEIKQVVEKVMIGVAGSQERIGVTHNAIILANYLRKKGFSVALAEYNEKNFIPQKDGEKFNSYGEKFNQSDEKETDAVEEELTKESTEKVNKPKTAFEGIQDSFDEKIIEGWYFNLNNIDYYPNCNNERLSNVLGKSYNFIIIDFGAYEKCDKITYGKCAERIIIAGAQAWEMDSVNTIFDSVPAESIRNMNFCFNFVNDEDLQKEVKENMEDIGEVYFLKYTRSPYEEYDFSGADVFLKKYMPIRIAEEDEKKGFFRKIFKKSTKKDEVSKGAKKEKRKKENSL